jgi:hypothetical protein
MIAEQSTSSVFLLGADQPAAEIAMTVRMEIPQPDWIDGGDVSTLLRYELTVPEQLQDQLHRALFDGVHAGFALIDSPLPEGGIHVEVSRLVIDRPQLETLVTGEDIRQVAMSLHNLVAWTVASLWQGLKTWSAAPSDRGFYWVDKGKSE